MYIAEISFFVISIMNSILVKQVTRNKELRTKNPTLPRGWFDPEFKSELSRCCEKFIC